MKLLGISCGRPMGNSELLLKQALKAAEDTGAEVSFLRLQDYYVRPCDGCELCTILRNQGKPLRCKHSADADDFFFLMDRIKETDGIIIATPAYHLMPPGILSVMLNRVHCAGFFNSSDINAQRSRVCATIGVGGTEWTDFLLPYTNFVGTEMCGSKMNLVDQMLVQFVPSAGAVAIYPETLERAALLGKRVAEAMGTPNGQVKYLGDQEEVCPICHANLLQVRGNRVACPICDVEGEITVEDGQFHVHWLDGIEKSRWSEYGGRIHREHRENARDKAIAGKEAVAQLKKEWKDYLEPVMPQRGTQEKGE